VVIVFLTINYLSANSLSINIPLPNLYQYLPPKSQQVLGETTDYINSSALPEKANTAVRYLQEFPEKHLKQLKIDIINYLAKELINRIDSPK
jgi:hypothetical protein